MEIDFIRIQFYMILKILIFISIFFITRNIIVMILFKKILNSEKIQKNKNIVI